MSSCCFRKTRARRAREPPGQRTALLPWAGHVSLPFPSTLRFLLSTYVSPSRGSLGVDNAKQSRALRSAGRRLSAWKVALFGYYGAGCQFLRCSERELCCYRCCKELSEGRLSVHPCCHCCRSLRFFLIIIIALLLDKILGTVGSSDLAALSNVRFFSDIYCNHRFI